MIKFGNSYIEGFGPIQEAEFNWDQPGLNIIQAPNGFGKTKLINSLVWVLYGKTLSGSVEPWEHTRSKSYKGTKVTLELTIGEEEIYIERYKDYPKFKNDLIVEIDGEEQPGSKPELNQLIIDKLGYTLDLFKNAIIFGQKLKRIIEEKGPNKKKIFEDAFQISYLERAKKNASEKYNELNVEFDKENTKLTSIETQISSKESEILSQEKMVKNFEKDKEEDIKEINLEIKEIVKKKDKIGSLNKLYSERDLLSSELEELCHDLYTKEEVVDFEKKLNKAEFKIDSLKEDKVELGKKITELKESMEGLPQNCHACGKPYTAIERKNAIKVLKNSIEKKEKQQKDIDASIEEYKGQIKELNETITSANNALNEVDILEDNIDALDKKISTLSDYNKDIEKLKDKIKKIQKKKLETNLDELNLELRQLKTKQTEKERELRTIKADLRIYHWLVKDPLSNSGIKTFIFNRMLDDINERLEYYSSFVDLQVAFFMDMQSAHRNLETYVIKQNEPVPYEDLSGGQQQAVDIVTAFAIHDVVGKNKKCSLLIMDEVFESLDSNNIEIMSEIIQDKAVNKSLFLVTHRAEFNPTNANMIEIDYSNGTTSIT